MPTPVGEFHFGMEFWVPVGPSMGVIDTAFILLIPVGNSDNLKILKLLPEASLRAIKVVGLNNDKITLITGMCPGRGLPGFYMSGGGLDMVVGV
jgi:hypothetical protein